MVGTAFTKVVDSLVADIFTPIVGLATGGVNISEQRLQLYGEAYLSWGKFFQAVINFVIIGWCMFMTVKGINASDCFPEGGLEKLPSGEYTVQAVFATNRDVNLPFAPGNRYCEPVRVKPDPAAGTTVTLTLDRTQPDDAPKDTATHKYLRLPSKLLSDFHGRPMLYRVGVVLPRSFAKEPDRRYGLVVEVGGFGTPSTAAAGIEPDPRFVQIVPHGAGPFGEPYQVDSANNGPTGRPSSVR